MLLDSLFRYLDSPRQATRTRRLGRQRAHRRSVPRPLVLERLEERALPSFLAAQAFDTGFGSASVAVGDFNGDGIPDLAVANRGTDIFYHDDGSVSVLLGNGDGTFQAARNFAAGLEPWSVAVGDFRHNGILDLAVANHGSNTVSVLLGNGDGTFR